MIKLKQGIVKISEKIKGRVLELGVREDDRKYDMVEITAPEAHASIHEKVENALSGLMEQIADFAEQNGKDGSFVMTAMQNNIKSFNLCAGSGYSDAHKAVLVDSPDNDVTSLDDFLPPKSGTTTVKAEEVIGGLSL